MSVSSRPWQAALLGTTALLSAACGGSPAAALNPNKGQLTVQNMDAFAHCMRDHGLPDFYFSSASQNTDSTTPMLMLRGWVVPDPNTPQAKTAMNACHNIIGLPSGPPPAPTVAQLRSMDKAAACMRAHGYPTWPDPSVQNGQLVNPGAPAGVDVNSLQFQQVAETCHLSSPEHPASQ